MKLIDLLISTLIPGLILVHLWAAPYTKVEESFNLQASHDVLVYGTPISNINEFLRTTYDHFTFPGAVPRTFVGPVLLAGLSQPLVALTGYGHAQFVVRAVLGLFNAASLLVLRHNVERAFGKPTARWFVLLQASQFHVMFYASRPLPNMFAFGLTTLAFSFLLPHPDRKAMNPRQRLAVCLFVYAAVIFRSEVAILLAASALYLLVIPQTSLDRLFPPFAVSSILALAVSVLVDSYFWQKPLWPELWGFYYNAILGSSSDWGVSPWHYYFTSALPRLLLNPLVPALLIPLALFHPATAKQARHLVYPPILFTAIYSLQPHKEARFIFYTVPPLTAAAAMGANFVFARRAKSALLALVSLALAASVILSFAASAAMLLLSSLNYPGGDALAHLSASLLPASPAGPVSVHADVLSCMTGVTLFNTPPAVSLDKTEDPARLADPAFWSRFDYVLAEDPPAPVAAGPWEAIAVVEAYAGVEVLRPGAAPGSSGGRAGPVVGRGALVARVRQQVRRWTGGWWAGPRMTPRISIFRRVREDAPEADAVDRCISTWETRR